VVTSIILAVLVLPAGKDVSQNPAAVVRERDGIRPESASHFVSADEIQSLLAKSQGTVTLGSTGSEPVQPLKSSAQQTASPPSNFRNPVVGGGNQIGAPGFGGFLTGPSEGDPLKIALDYIRQNREALGLTEDDLTDVVVKDRYLSNHNRVTHIYLRQRFGGIEVFNGDININISGDGRVINLGNGFVPGLKNFVKVKAPSMPAITAVEKAAQYLGVPITEPLVPRESANGVAQDTLFSGGGIAEADIPVRLMYLPPRPGVAQAGEKGEVRLMWNMVIRMRSDDHWWNLGIDAVTGNALLQHDWTAQDSYEVFALPKEHPNDGPRTITGNPANATASPFAWHDTNGTAGAEFSTTRGNNVHAYADRNADNIADPGSEPDGGPTLNFTGTLVPLDLTKDPSTYTAAAVTNLFYWNNIVHDVFYLYGFNEAAGNFQVNNRGLGGLGNDDVRAEAQNGADVGIKNNATFSTPPDGERPRMQMFVFDFTNPKRDSDLDNGIITHEYGHGVSTRLTGGPSNSGCLNNAEQMGEGWSDFFALVLTAVPGDSSTTSRGSGTYVLGQPPDGVGARPKPYTTDLTVNPTTYGDIGGLVIPHGVGYAWAGMLWEVYWNLVAKHGFNGNIFGSHTTGGNNLALQLVVDGLTLQPCSPGFVNGRDAILDADMVLTGGANQCPIWKGFAKRGLGFSASQGSSSSTTDGAQAFDLPPNTCLKVTKSASPSPVALGQVLTYTLTASNPSGGTLTGVTITDSVPPGTVFVPGSANCGGGVSGGVVSFPLGAMANGEVRICAFQVSVMSSVTGAFTDNMESGSGPWTVTGSGAANWVLGTNNPHSATHAWFADDISTVSDQRLEMANPLTVMASPSLSFWHHYNTESVVAVGFDGGVVEISANGGPWTDLGPLMTQNGYNRTISSCCGNPLAGRKAFAGDSLGYLLTIVDLSSHQGSSIKIRFRLGTDSSVRDVGWHVDDVQITSSPGVPNTACVQASEGDSGCAPIATLVGCVPPASGDWVVAQSCTFTGSTAAPGNVIVEAGVALTIAGGASLDINFSTKHLRIKNGAKVVIKSGGKIN
jgi:extracellular elastinolytic metalloproteinase